MVLLFMPASLKHLVQLVANVFDSFTAALFIRSHQEDDLHLVAWESLSPYIVPGVQYRGWSRADRLGCTGGEEAARNQFR